MTPNYAHRQVQASRARVDEKMAPLLELLWARGYDTQFSCQGGLKAGHHSIAGGIASRSMFGSELSDADIIFATYEDGARFLKETTTLLGWPTGFYSRLWFELMALRALPPLRSMAGESDGVRANVLFRHDLIDLIVEAFAKSPVESACS